MDICQEPPRDEFIGQRIRAARLAANLTQAALAERLGITFQQIQKYETGKNRISAPSLFKVARLLSVPVESFDPEGCDTKYSFFDDPRAMRAAIALAQMPPDMAIDLACVIDICSQHAK